ncbi:hypothetical protein ACH5RR_015728 [Cinchona calisaya]|uniref:Uncharacterized protein n=1 Tax=Cinchona calisaya TaxID=153742 RepID=A0ABD2ZTZ2_9GENT
MLDGESLKSFPEERLLLQGNMYNNPVRPHKKKKASNGHNVVVHHLYNSSEPKTKAGTLGAEGSDVCKHASLNEFNQIQTAQVLKDGMNGLLGSNLHQPGDSEEVFGHDYMKLVELDNNNMDESRFRQAMEKPISPLSPSLCNIDFTSSVKSETEIATSRPLADESLYKGFSKAEDNMIPSCSLDVINLEIDSNERSLKNLGDSKIMLFGITKRLNDNCESLGNNGSDDSDLICASAASVERQNSSMLSAEPRNEDLEIPYERRSDRSNGFPKYCALLSNNSDSNTIYKIFRVCSDCMSQCSSNSSLKFFIQNILLSLRKADDLSAEEQVSAFFSLLLHYISEITNGDLEKYAECDSLQFINSFSQQMCAVLNDVDTRRIFLESCDMCDLVVLIEDFLLNSRILVYDDVSHELTFECDSRRKVVLDGNCIFWSSQAASINLVSAGALLLGSICAAVDQIGFVFEVSCNIFSLKTIDSLLLLRLLHIFAYTCGSKFFILEDYGLEMSVLKCLVVLLERQNFAMDCFSSVPTVLPTSMKISACRTCPFSNGAGSVDFIVSVLLEKLQNYALFCAGRQDPGDTSHSSHHLSEVHEMRTEDDQHHGEAVPPNFVSDQYLCYFIDILSLVELVASFMNWDWTFGNVVSRLFQMLDSCVQDDFFPAIITLLGQLGRLGVDAKGYGDSGVQRVREWLSAFVSKSTFSNFGFPIQFACVCALVGLISRSFEEVVKTNFDIAVAGSQSIAMDCVRKWFSSLTNEQQSTFRSLQSSKYISTRGKNLTIAV